MRLSCPHAPINCQLFEHIRTTKALLLFPALIVKYQYRTAMEQVSDFTERGIKMDQKQNHIMITGTQYQVALTWNNHAAWIEGGYFGEVSVCKSSLFQATLRNTLTGQEVKLSSESWWQEICVISHDLDRNRKKCIHFSFLNPETIPELTFLIKGIGDDTGISWTIEVANDNSQWSVMEVTYPIPLLQADYFDMFLPIASGLVVSDAGRKDYSYQNPYPQHEACMQYFAVYGKQNGIYLGIEDGRAAVKYFDVTTAQNQAHIKVIFYGIDGSLPANSFTVYGCSRWQFITGDWYDATLLYRDFVKNEANWLPEIDLNGRPDTPKRFKEVPFWVSDYIPNSPSQGDNKPLNLSAGSDKYNKDYWVDAVIELQKELDVPIAYHVYNWHQIPFNIEYPHFMPAKQEFIDGAERLRKHPIYILPYINAVSWEMHDGEMGHAINFDNTGIHGAVIKNDNTIKIVNYPQTTQSGHNSQLIPMCPSFPEWHKLMNDLTRQMEDRLPIDGIYYDQVSATAAVPCYNKEHRHTMGGGSYWVEGYRMMMSKINAQKPADSFYFSECNSEPFTKSFDGFLTWTWVQNGQVPAFSAIYAGYIEMLGRCTNGHKKDDDAYFFYSTAQSFLYGQQLGWCKADVLYDKKRMGFLKKIVKERYHYTELFHSAQLLRPAKVAASCEPIVTGPALWFQEDIVIPQLLTGAWKYRNGEKLVLFLINIADQTQTYTLSFSAKEYGLADFDLPADFVVDEDVCTVSGTIEPLSMRSWECSVMNQ